MTAVVVTEVRSWYVVKPGLRHLLGIHSPCALMQELCCSPDAGGAGVPISSCKAETPTPSAPLAQPPQPQVPL